MPSSWSLFSALCLIWSLLAALASSAPVEATVYKYDVVVLTVASPHVDARDDAAAVHQYDVIIYGNTVAALAAALQVKRMRKTVAVVFPGNTLGGLTTSGLGWTDNKNGDSIGGIAREFYNRVFNYYQSDSVWTYEARVTYRNKNIRAQPGTAIEDEKKMQWTFEPKAAEYIWEQWVIEADIPIFRNEAIDRSGSGVVMNGTQIASFKTLTGAVFEGKMFMDAGYDGDLMEAVGIPYRTGREGRADFDEPAGGFSLNGPNRLANIDPYRERGNASSGLISGIQRVINDTAAITGYPDPHRLQSYNFRLSLTKVPLNKKPFFKPEGYNETKYEILFRYIENGYRGPFFTSQLMPNLKTDSNAAGQVSTDLIGGNYNNESNYAEYSYAQRETTMLAHKIYTQGFLWTLANHPRIPLSVRTDIGHWGYAKDEFVRNDNFPPEIYIREGRRMAGMYTMSQRDVQVPKEFPRDAVVGMGCYFLDVHQVERVVVQDRVYDEGLVHIITHAPFAIPFNSIVPDARYATNFLNPVTMSSTHIAYSAIRMEPTYMIMGQSAGTAAVMAIEQGVNIQDVNRGKLTARLNADKQILSP
ncbi:FAD dependent oxidoreductase-domain-containing protein [Dactylonectria estremocensis]|uniref:FAD dependent oxidoreductase-domain-containing protein n=1 Tax=Dactylonectria estremocensis TaxID=1079267 RepID=A0A9P9EKT3_9HYPO|nr:FAD dependent oxidoreductase-domain-containing protein [Dactylonectria estremocensis]